MMLQSIHEFTRLQTPHSATVGITRARHKLTTTKDTVEDLQAEI